VHAAVAEELVVAQVDAVSKARHRFREEVGLKVIVTCHDRRMRGKDAPLLHPLFRLFKRVAFVETFVQQLQHEERTVPLVGVVHVRFDAERTQHANAADAEDELLPDALVVAALVESARKGTKLLRVGFEVGVEQVEVRLAEGNPPGPDLNGLRGDAHRDGDRIAAAAARDEGDRMLGRIKNRIGGLLPPLGVERLSEVALPQKQTNGREGQSEVGGRF